MSAVTESARLQTIESIHQLVGARIPEVSDPGYVFPGEVEALLSHSRHPGVVRRGPFSGRDLIPRILFADFGHINLDPRSGRDNFGGHLAYETIHAHFRPHLIGVLLTDIREPENTYLLPGSVPPYVVALCCSQVLSLDERIRTLGNLIRFYSELVGLGGEFIRSLGLLYSVFCAVVRDQTDSYSNEADSDGNDVLQLQHSTNVARPIVRLPPDEGPSTR